MTGQETSALEVMKFEIGQSSPERGDRSSGRTMICSAECCGKDGGARINAEDGQILESRDLLASQGRIRTLKEP
jgi:hypothetical protein